MAERQDYLLHVQIPLPAKSGYLSVEEAEGGAVTPRLVLPRLATIVRATAREASEYAASATLLLAQRYPGATVRAVLVVDANGGGAP